jgi:YegS/Rv2252/BmrU family lipid kinase
MTATPLKILFIINPGAGIQKTDWKKEIQDYFDSQPHSIELFEFSDPCDPAEIRKKIESSGADRVVAVGGDGTLKLAANILQNTGTPVGLLPAGSANGMAKELGIPADAAGALDTIVSGEIKKIHVVRINDELCIHLSDIGFNAFVVKKFEDEGTRGMWGYTKAAWKVLWNHYQMKVKIKADDDYIQRDAAMVVIANATKYGTGVLINPEGRLDDDQFEVVIVKKISFAEIFKMRFTHRPYDHEKTELLQTRSLEITSKRRAHFQVDGEYRGRVNTIKAEIIPGALSILIPVKKN